MERALRSACWIGHKTRSYWGSAQRGAGMGVHRRSDLGLGAEPSQAAPGQPLRHACILSSPPATPHTQPQPLHGVTPCSCLPSCISLCFHISRIWPGPPTMETLSELRLFEWGSVECKRYCRFGSQGEGQTRWWWGVAVGGLVKGTTSPLQPTSTKIHVFTP